MNRNERRRMDAEAAERAFAEAVAAYRKGHLALAERRLVALRRSFPDHPDVLHLLGVVLLGLDRPAEAAESLARSLRAAEAAGRPDRDASSDARVTPVGVHSHDDSPARPDIVVPVLNALGSALRRTGQAEAAAAIFRRAADLSPGDADVLFNLGAALWQGRAYAEAAKVLRTAAALKPADPEILFAFGEAARLTGDAEAALAAFRSAVFRNPAHAKAHAGIGAILAERRDIMRARAALKQALALDPGLAEAHMAEGVLRLGLGDADGAVAADAEAVRLNPSLAVAHSNLVQHMSYSARHSAAEILAEAQAWNARHAAPLHKSISSFPRKRESSLSVDPRLRGGDGLGGNWGFLNTRDPDKRLKIGYVGGDFCAHPAGQFFLAFLPFRDPNAIETFVYMTGTETDQVTGALRAHADRWRDAALLDDAGLAEAVRADGIDILVDAAGHTAMNRLLAFAGRAAPVQATGFGVMGTTGIAAMDYFLGDRFEIPPGYEKFYSEAVVRLPDDNVCFAPPGHAPAVAPLPARETGRVTFGCFNMAGKITPESVALWSRVLKDAPGSRMLLKNFGLGVPECRERFLRLFAEAGIGAERLILEGPSPHAELLAAYGRVDVALDPIPYSGGLTTFESLWMGAPVVTLPGETFASRHSASHLANAGLPELIAKDSGDYTAIAAGLASDLDALAALRAALRPRMAASPVCDGARYARGLEAAFRAMWRAWCRDEKPAALDIRLPGSDT